MLQTPQAEASEAGAAGAEAPSPPAELLVCVKCRLPGVEAAADETRPGQRLYDALAAAALPDGVSVTPVECLSNCNRGCTIALRGDARWTYVYGGFDAVADLPAALAAIQDGSERYRATTDGLVPWRERPEHFKRNCIARVPPLPPLTPPVPETSHD